MAKKKYYAVRKGISTGIFESWAECQVAVTGFSNAEYQSFSTHEEAEQYFYGNEITKTEVREELVTVKSAGVIAYVDGSYDDKLKKYAFGCILLTPSGEIIKESGNGDNPASLAIRNVAGEMLGAMYAVKWAIKNGYSEIEIRYDYEGIEKWVQGEWKAKNELARKYFEAMNEWKKSIKISFQKVVAHSNNKYNDMADSLAKLALTEGKGIPQIKRGEYWFTAKNIDRKDILAIIELVQEEYGDKLTTTEGTVAHGILKQLHLSKKDYISIHHYNNNKLMVQGKPQELFSCLITYVTELVDIDDIPQIFNETYKLQIDKENVKNEYIYYLPNSYNKLSEKMSRVLHQAVYNLNISGDMFDGTFLAQPAMRVLEGHLKKILIEKNVIPDDKYIRMNGFDCFEPNGAKYHLKTKAYGTATKPEADYFGRCYTFYHNNRHILEHWDDPTAPLDTTKTLDCEGAHSLIKRALEVIDEYFTI